MKFPAFPPLLPLLAATLLAACGEPSPEAAKARLAEKNLAAEPATLLAKTKEGKAGEADSRLLVAAGVDPNARQENGMTALMSAVFNGQHETARALLARGADPNATAQGFNALKLAIERNDAAMAKLLLDAGAKPEQRPEGRPSALELAESRGSAELVELLRRAAGR